MTENIATTVRIVLSLHIITCHQTPISVSFSKTFFICIQEWLSFYDIFIYLRPLIWSCITYHTDCALCVYHFRICLVYVTHKDNLSKLHGKCEIKKRSSIVCMHIVCLVKKKMNAKQIRRHTQREEMIESIEMLYKLKLRMTHGFMVDTLATMTDFFLHHNKCHIISVPVFGINSIKLFNIIYTYTPYYHVISYIVLSVYI